MPGFLIDLAQCLDAEHKGLTEELQTVANGLEHIKQIVGALATAAREDGKFSREGFAKRTF